MVAPFMVAPDIFEGCLILGYLHKLQQILSLPLMGIVFVVK